MPTAREGLTQAKTASARIDAVDLLRGLVMVLMALDHVRDFFGGIGVSPTNLATTTVPLFLTRWVTHICAPTFFLLTGTSASFVSRRRSGGDLSRYLLKRGLWLVFLDAVVVRCLAMQFNVDYHVTILNVLWALGWSMVALSALVALPAAAVLSIGVVMIAGHNLLDPIRPAALGALAPLWTVLHVQGFLVNRPGFVVLSAYPLIPWIGVTAAGFALGRVFGWTPPRRQAFLFRTGAAMTVAFVLLRWVNVYGDPSRWSVQKSAAMAVVSFLNTTKYPPSLLFLLMTLGPALLLLAAFDRGTSRPGALRTFGRVPLFYFVVHLFAIHLLAVIICAFRFGAIHWMFESPDLGHFPITEPPGWPLPLPLVYAIWIGIVIALYPLCRWYEGVRMRRAHPLLSYL
jgi:uncharacterized membrane protein